MSDPTIQLNLTLTELATVKVVLDDSYEMIDQAHKMRPEEQSVAKLRHNLVTIRTKINFVIERLEN